MKTAHTYKELREIAGDWSTTSIRNDYKIGSDNFCITYQGQTVMYQNDDISNVANCATQYNGLSWSQFLRFNSADYKNQ